MDRWEEGFDTWTPRGNEVPSEDTDTDVDREELLRLARELGARRQADHGQANDEVERLKQSLRERAEAVAARERELEELRRKLEAGRAPVLDRFRRSGADDEAVAARERAALERARALDERERAVEGRAGELAGEAERLAERERELEAELAAAQARLAETAAERELAERERERLEERDRAAHDVEKSLAATRIAIEQERERLEARERELAAQVRELEARAGVLGSAAVVETDTPESDAAARLAALDAREQELERLETKVEARERDLLLLRQGLDSERNALLERERALRRREVAEVRESFAPPLAPPSFSEGLAALARRTRG